MGEGRAGTVELRNVTKRYAGSAPVLDGVNLTVAPGDVVGVVGANGCGKSTLLRIMVGLSTPTAGTVTGRPAVVGYVPEKLPGHGRVSARAYLTHLGRIRGLSGRQAAGRARELLDRLSLVGGAGTSLRRLSKGNAQKVALAQALLVPPVCSCSTSRGRASTPPRTRCWRSSSRRSPRRAAPSCSPTTARPSSPRTPRRCTTSRAAG
ncbi:ATP-binding cassette domain-containing protein [Luedemannella flava]